MNSCELVGQGACETDEADMDALDAIADSGPD